MSVEKREREERERESEKAEPNAVALSLRLSRSLSSALSCRSLSVQRSVSAVPSGSRRKRNGRAREGERGDWTKGERRRKLGAESAPKNFTARPHVSHTEDALCVSALVPVSSRGSLFCLRGFFSLSRLRCAP